MSAQAHGTAELHVALAAVARAIADSLEVRQVWDRVFAACRTIVPFDALGVVCLELAEVTRILVVVEDVLAVELVHQTPNTFFALSSASAKRSTSAVVL